MRTSQTTATNNNQVNIKGELDNSISQKKQKLRAKRTLTASNEDSPTYKIEVEVQDEENNIITKALEILSKRMRQANTFFNAPAIVKSYFQLKLAELGHEVFSVVFLDAQHGVIEYDEMFKGTLTQTSVYPREIVKRALSLNAAAVIFSHNHPSGNTEPSLCIR